MLCHTYRLLGLLFAVSVPATAAHPSKQSVYYNTTGLTSSSFVTNSISSYGTIPSVSATDRSTGFSKTKHPHSRYSTGTSPRTTKTRKHSHTPTGSVYTTNSTTTPPSTTVSTVSSTTSSTPPTCTPTTFKLQVTLNYVYPGAPPVEGNYVFLVPGGVSGDGGEVMELTADALQASTFSLNADCTLQSGTEIAALPPLAAYTNFAFYPEATIASGGFYETTCQVNGFRLGCSTNTGSYFTNDVLYTCQGFPPYVIIEGPTGRPQNQCYDLSLLIVPI